MTSDTDSQLLINLEQVFDYVDQKLQWAEPEQSEKEPAYTERVLAPQLAQFLSRSKSPFVLRADGLLRPQPVVFDAFSSFPDLAFNNLTERFAAIEVKFYSGPSDKGALLTAIGQAAIYLAGGYKFAAILLVARYAGTGLIEPDLDRLRESLALQNIKLFSLS